VNRPGDGTADNYLLIHDPLLLLNCSVPGKRQL
jgi:hypothetical protein